MKKFEGLLICTDLDGTLLRSDKSISKENLEAIEHFKAEGGLFTFITGRMPCTSGDIYNVVHPNAPFGCINGGGIYDHRTSSYIWTLPISNEAIELAEYAAEMIPEIGYQANTFDRIYFCRENSAMEHFRKVTNTPNVFCRGEDIKEPIAKIVFGDADTENINRLAEVLAFHPLAQKFDFIRSEHHLYEILPKGSNKGTLLPRLAAHLGISMEKTVAIGDYNNDINMLKTAKIGVAVANAHPDVKEIADYITVSNEEHAIAKIIWDIESGALKM